MLDKWVDGCWEKNMCYVMKITKQRLAVGLFSAVPTSAAAAPPTHSSI